MTHDDKYVLDARGEPIACHDLMQWARWMETGDRRVAFDFVNGVRVSTVFLGLDHRFELQESKPVLWETMIFGGSHDGYQVRYTSRELALEGHAKALALVRGGGQ